MTTSSGQRPWGVWAIATMWAVLTTVGAGAQYVGEEDLTPIQKTAVIGGVSRDLDAIGPMIMTEKTNTTLNCAAGSMMVDVEFHDPFHGIIYPNGSRNSACLTQGNGKLKYHLELPLKGCGTERAERRVFVNNIIVRFHPGLELEGDEVKTIICRYPSPEVLPPPGPPVPIIAGPSPVTLPAGVSEIEILLIICAIVFLALLLVGMACSYTCLKKRNIKLVRRRPMSLGSPSTITKMSGSSLIFDGVKIPRAHATSTSDSDTALVSQSDTMPSDYPSESPSSGSEVEEVDVHSIGRHASSVSSHVSAMREEMTQAYHNQAYVMEEDRLSSVYSDNLVQSDAEIVMAAQKTRPFMPSFMVRVKRAPTPPRTPEPDYPVQTAQAQNLTTILERDESFRAESIPGSEHALLVSDMEDLEPPPMILPPPEYARVQRKTQTLEAPRPPPSEYGSVTRSVSEHDLRMETRLAPPCRDVQHMDHVQLVTTQTTDVQEVVERNAHHYMVRHAPSEPESEYPSEARSVTDVVTEDDRVVALREKPSLTTHVVDDRHVSTVTETRTTEDLERHRRFIKQYHMKPKALPPPKWNVAIRHYPGPKYADEAESSGPEWEAYSEPGSDVFRHHLYQADTDDHDAEALEHPPPHNWHVLLRVLEPPETQEAVQCVLSQEDLQKWRQIITTESTLRTMLTTAHVKEDFERIRRDQRYEKLFEPRKWDVIIRILSPPQHPGGGYGRQDSSSEAPETDTESLLSSRDGRRYRRHETATGGRRPSLPPLYEYDSAGNPMVVRGQPGPPSSRSRRSSKSSIHSGLDVRSMAETEVNFARDSWSEASGPSMASGAPSIADRSHSEITYSVPVMADDEYPDTDFDDRSSARTGRSLARSASEFTEDWRHHDNERDRYSHISESSVDSKRHPQMERSTTEYFSEVPHLSDVMTSPDHTPTSSPRTAAKYQHQYQYHQNFDNKHFDRQTFEVAEYIHDDAEQFNVSNEQHRYETREGYTMHHERHGTVMQQLRLEHPSSNHSTGGRDEIYSAAENEMLGWVQRH